MLLSVLLSVALAGGFRFDGSGQAPDAHPNPGPVLWKLALPAAGNASVVPLGDDVCVTQDPGTVLCVNAQTGAPHWQANHPIVDVIGADDTTRAKVAAAETASAGLGALRESVGPLTKRARRGDDAAKAELAQVRARLTDDEAAIAEVKDLITPPVEPHNGWSSPTPVTDGEHLWVAFGDGVVACHAKDGTLLWRRWLGPHTSTLAFFAGIPTASPTLVDGVLVVAYGSLLGLDPTTGETRWTGPVWEDYGSPTAMDVGGLGVVLTPAGDVLRAKDGAVIAEGLSQHPWFNAPLVDGDVVWWVGGQYTPTRGFRAEARAVRLARAGDGVVATELSRTPLPSEERFYAGPVVFGERLYAVDNTGRLFGVDRATGALTVDQALKVGSQVWAAPIVDRDRLWIPVLDGSFVVLDAGLVEVARPSVGELTLSTPWVAGERMWVRSTGALWAL
jgi:outer membrane protein assembly factor BamB